MYFIVLEGFDSIEELPLVGTIGVGIKDGKAVSFNLDDYSNESKLSVIKVYDEYESIKKVDKERELALVETADKKKGIINAFNGKIIAEAVYRDIQWESYLVDDDGDSCTYYLFICQKDDGTYEIKREADQI